MTILRGYWKSLLVALIILYGSLLREPHFSLPPIDYGDKWVHLLVYAMLGSVALWDSMRYGLKGWRIVVVALVLPVLYGGAIEIVQELWFYPRTGDWVDWLADSVGVSLGCGITASFNAIKAHRS